MAANIMPLIVAFSEFSRKCEETSEECKYLNEIFEMTSRLQNLVSADREGNWDNHIQAVTDLLHIFIEADSIYYLCYASWYFESIRQLLLSHPDVYEQFKANHMLFVKTNAGRFNAGALDVKLEQTIQLYKKVAGGIIG